MASEKATNVEIRGSCTAFSILATVLRRTWDRSASSSWEMPTPTRARRTF
jgi:hypothetical protein